MCMYDLYNFIYFNIIIISYYFANSGCYVTNISFSSALLLPFFVFYVLLKNCFYTVCIFCPFPAILIFSLLLITGLYSQ